MKFELKKHWWIAALLGVALIIWGSSGFPMPGSSPTTEQDTAEYVTAEVPDCSEIEHQLNEATSLAQSLQAQLDKETNCDESYAKGLAAGRAALVHEQDSMAQVSAKLQIGNMGIYGASFEAVNWDNIGDISSEDGLSNVGFDFAKNDGVLRGIYSNPQRLQNDYNRAKRFVRPALTFLFQTDLIQESFKSICQEWVTNRLHFCKTTPYDAKFTQGWKAKEGEPIYDWNDEEYWTELGLPKTVYGLPVSDAALRWKFVQRRMDEAEEYHGFNRIQTQKIWGNILRDLQNQLRGKTYHLPC